MNVFYLDKCPVKSAEAQCDKHVVKMILETAQLLSTAHRVLDGDKYADHAGLYKATHKNHPSAVWVRQSAGNYRWLHRHLIALCSEYTRRYKKLHATERLVHHLREQPQNMIGNDFAAPPQCMPDEYHCTDSVAAYRSYYKHDKLSQPWAKYSYTEMPSWTIQ